MDRPEHPGTGPGRPLREGPATLAELIDRVEDRVQLMLLSLWVVGLVLLVLALAVG